MDAAPKKFNMSKTIVIFSFSVPLFFILAVAGLYFIVMEEHIKGSAEVKLRESLRIYAPDDGEVIEIFATKNSVVGAGDKIIALTSRKVERQLAAAKTLCNDLALRHKILRLKLSAPEISGVSRELAAADAELLANQLRHAQANKRELEKRRAALTITAPGAGRLVDFPARFITEPITTGELIARMGDTDTVKVEIAIPEEKVGKVSLGQKVRFESATLSVNKNFNRYFSGAVVAIDPIKAARESGDERIQRRLYRITADIDYNPQLPPLPIGSTGTAAIVVGRRSLLLQLIGW